MKKFLFQLNHPAHYHLFKNTMKLLQEKGHIVFVSIKDKDILKDLVQDYEHIQISHGYRKNNFVSIVKSVLLRDMRLFEYVKKIKPDVMIGTSPEIGHISPFVNVPAIFFGEDDVLASLPLFIGAIFCYPLFKTILAPIGVNNSVWNRKTITYNGYQKLAYLHPNYFFPDRSKVDVSVKGRYYLLRFSKFTAYHDTKTRGISDKLAKKIVNLLEGKGKVLISSERELPPELKKYEFKGNKKDIHHYLYYADLYIGDSQSMAVEAAMLGTPNIRYNGYINYKISIFDEIMNKYNLSIGVMDNEPDKLLKLIESLINNENTVHTFKKRRERLLKEKTDVTSFFVWFLVNYPESIRLISKYPDYHKYL